MKNKDLENKTVLVIGWEYPPRMVGGLAIATHEIVKALSNFINVILIIPYKDKNTPVDDNVQVLGLNSIEEDLPLLELHTILSKIIYFKDEQMISSYPLTTTLKKETNLDADNDIRIKSKSYLNLFKSDEVYGWGLWERMKAYKEVVGIIAQQLSFDIVHCHDWLTFEAGCKVKKITGKPLALHVHALETDRIGISVNNRIYNIELRAMQYSDLIFSVSNYTKKCIINHYKILEHKIVPIHNATSKIDISRWRHRIPQKIVTFLGRITSQKGPEFLLETVEKVVSKYKNVRFVIAGSGDKFENLVMSSAYNKLSKYILFTGFIKRDDVNALLATSDVYFMPSVSEPFGLTALEAARAGVPCVISKQSGVSEVLVSALKADFWDTQKFANQILQLLIDGELKGHISKKQREEIEQVSWSRSAEKIALEYYKLLN